MKDLQVKQTSPYLHLKQSFYVFNLSPKKKKSDKFKLKTISKISYEKEEEEEDKYIKVERGEKLGLYIQFHEDQHPMRGSVRRRS